MLESNGVRRDCGRYTGARQENYTATGYRFSIVNALPFKVLDSNQVLFLNLISILRKKRVCILPS